MYVNFNILNQLGSPSLNSNTFANRPAAGQTGRLFISTDTFEIYRDNGTGWDLIGTGTGGGITGSGTANQVTYWTGTSAVGGESAFTYNPTTNALRVDGKMSMETDSSWGSGTSALQMQNGSVQGASGSVVLTYNLAYSSSDYRYIITDRAFYYSQSSGSGHVWASAVSGTAGTVPSFQTAMVLDLNRNLGVATNPPNWYSIYKAVSLHNSNFYTDTTSTTVGGIASNSYLDNTSLSWKYLNTAAAARMEFDSGAFNWFTAPSGTAGADFTYTRRLRLTNNGHLNFNTADTTWGSTTRVIHFTQGMAIWSQTSNNANNYINTGLYWDGQLRRLTGSQSSQINFSEGLLTFSTASGGAVNSVVTLNEGFRLTVSSNLLIGTTTDGGQRLQVVGDSLFSGGSTTIRGAGTGGGSTALLLQNSTPQQILDVRNNGNFIFGTSGNPVMTPGDRTTGGSAITGSGLVFNFQLANPGAGSDLWITGGNITTTTGTLNHMIFSRSFVPTSGTSVYNTQLLQPTINQTGGANGITRGIQINPTLTSAADWRSLEISNNSGWGIYQSGASANNYFNGDVLVGTTTDSGFKFDVNGSTRLNGTVRVDGQTSGTAGGASGQHLIINCDGTTYKIALLNN